MALAKTKQTEDHDLRRSKEKEASYMLSLTRPFSDSNHDVCICLHDHIGTIAPDLRCLLNIPAEAEDVFSRREISRNHDFVNDIEIESCSPEFKLLVVGLGRPSTNSESIESRKWCPL